MTEDDKPKLTGTAKPWLQAIKDAEKAFEGWQRSCKNVSDKYASLKKLGDAGGKRELQIFWSNMQVMLPAVYQRPPVPVVMPRHSDTGEVVRKASELVERTLEFDVEDDDLHETLLEVRDDLGLFSRGVVWVLDDGSAIHVDRADFVHDPARRWKEVSWVARRAYLAKKPFKERFPDKADKWAEAEAEQVGKERNDDYKTTDKKVAVWEIWSKPDNRVYWVTEGVDDVLDEADPLFDVKGFFPCPKPAYGTLEPSTLKPVPDYVYYRDQADEIHELTDRISSLTESLRMKGFYASGTSEVGEAIETAMKQTDNRSNLVPISNLAALGGQSLKDSIIWLPVQEIAGVISDLIQLRKQLIEDVYEITGLSDIMRGVTDAQETLGAQNLKAEFGSVRVRSKQQEMVRIGLDVLSMKAEIYAETRDIQELMAMAGMRFPTMQEIQSAQAQGQKVDDVPLESIAQLLQDQRMRPFAMEVETDSTIAPNEMAEKQNRIEFLQAIGSFIGQAQGAVEAFPQSAPFMAELMRFGAGGFRAGRDLGGAIDQFTELVEQQAQGQQQQGPDPAMQAEQAKAQAEQAKAQADIEFRQRELDTNTQIRIQEMQVRQQEMAGKQAIEQARIQNDRYKMDLDSTLRQQDQAIKMRELGIKVDAQTLAEREVEINTLKDAAEIELEATQERPVGIGD
jgi:hypothetical protein